MPDTQVLASWRSLWLLLGLAAIVLAPPLWNAALLNFDDNLWFGPDNPEFRAAWQSGNWFEVVSPAQRIANAYLPVTHASLFADYVLAQALSLPPRWAHLHSLLLHVLAAFALARLLGRLGLHPGGATAAAALFLVHPALVESVAWVSSRKDVLSGWFVFVCLSGIAAYARRPASWRAAVVGLTAVAALYAKGTAVVLVLLAPIVAGLVRGSRLRWVVAVGVMVLAVLAGLHHTQIAASEGTLRAPGAPAPLMQAAGAFWHYLTTLVWPTRLNVLYPEVHSLETFRAQAWSGAAALGGLIVAVFVFWRRGARLSAIAIVMAVAAWLPFNTVLPASALGAADRYLYLVVPFAALALAALPRSGPMLAAVVVLPLGWLAADRAGAFKDSVKLWESSLRVQPENAVASLNLAMALLPDDRESARGLAARAVTQARYPEHRLRAEQLLRDLAWQDGRLEEASLHATRACAAAAELGIAPAALAARVGCELRAVSLALASSDQPRANQHLAAAQQLAPDDAAVLACESALLLAAALQATPKDVKGELARRAQDALQRALAKVPAHFEANLVAGQWAAARGELLAGLRHFRKARQAQPARPETYLGEVDLYLEASEFVGAEEAALAGIAAGADDPLLRLRLGLALAAQGRLADAKQWYEQYLVWRPRDAAARRALAAVLAAEVMPRLYQHDAATLEAAAARIEELDAGAPKAWLLRGRVARLRRDFAAALVLLEKVCEALPDNEDARRMLAECYRDRGYELLTPDPPAAALDCLRKFVDLAVPGLDTGAALDILRGHWQRSEARGVAAFAAGDLPAAAAAFRRCLALVPEQGSARFQLGLVLLRQGDDHLVEALECFEQAEVSQRALGLDVAMPVLYQLLTLPRLGRTSEVVARGEKFLATATAVDAGVLVRIQQAMAAAKGADASAGASSSPRALPR